MSNPLKNDDFYRFRTGRFECISVSDGYYEYDTRHLFKNLSESEVIALLRSLKLPTDKIISPYTFLFVDTGTNKVLVDMGAGKLGPNTGKLVRNLKSAGIHPGDIDTVIITHAHPDHIGGTLDDSGKPNYPNARYYIMKDEWDFWFSDEAFAKVQERLSSILRPEIFMKIAHEQLTPIKDHVEFVTQESELLPGVYLYKAYGHTPGHMVVSFTSEGEELFFTSDTVVFPFMLEQPEIIPVFDIMTDIADTSKHRIFDLVAERKAPVLAQHFYPFPSMGYIVKKDRGWLWQPIRV
ncbi:MAG: MBL fold metallo-hydrolase [Bacteroidales bacterium]|nr:MBL fold metallo-hydrolase [Bacteroidales bacterium]